MAVVMVFQEVLADNRITPQEWIQVLLGALMAFNVWATANLPGYDKMKTYVSAAIVVFGALYTFIPEGVTTTEVINMAILALSALGVAVTKQPITTVVDNQVTPSSRHA